jgi:hypothetical protein
MAEKKNSMAKQHDGWTTETEPAGQFSLTFSSSLYTKKLLGGQTFEISIPFWRFCVVYMVRA